MPQPHWSALRIASGTFCPVHLDSLDLVKAWCDTTASGIVSIMYRWPCILIQWNSELSNVPFWMQSISKFDTSSTHASCFRSIIYNCYRSMYRKSFLVYIDTSRKRLLTVERRSHLQTGNGESRSTCNQVSQVAKGENCASVRTLIVLHTSMAAGCNGCLTTQDVQWVRLIEQIW